MATDTTFRQPLDGVLRGIDEAEVHQLALEECAI